MHTTVTVSCPIAESPRVSQVRGMFDLTADRTSQVTWSVDLPLGQRPWHIGLVVGPSGCGKSTIARHLWPDAVHAANQLTWIQVAPSSTASRPACPSRTSPPIVLRRFLVAAGMAAAVPGIVRQHSRTDASATATSLRSAWCACE